ncbi:MAG: CDP-glucose 4,6-dehydratase [Candidatus Raymondbacteria bacterium RifOxyA12_full_50_37]|nr:MAG: CDP-glucose 4,6-dehydratase [Candidatus Raymondbacteria bacterium RifOxyA12_full_50_37]OGJ88519.1 MAG: CDP-glucose 4,6-dehydratase [Candidatus Raymondbacteria bacterium RIFOXYA2_FULL_49_16]OGJ98980.1 MAG: CDP-glucose 4,6-dehydratase [Candidatus Raymondbacteria bacterium RIFOXYC2_FULL_50_21]OGK00617.1 MAG: CDP-glucose 4,6-dehydratase [Candidatus Raymondbacteria bacterium RifOxyC12_full_50_8]OGP41490.1 MAG: CDP-glucose 4,6-dehydratase [Candidatus Raymondbacteria bacterium RIFOXYB2_FULL_49
MSSLSIYRNKTVLVTGSTGFKGSWLSIWLTSLGANVIGYALKPKTAQDNFVAASVESKITQIYGDIRNASKLSSLFKRTKPDFAFHLAAQPLVLDSYKEPSYTFEANVQGTVNFLEAIRACPSVRSGVVITTDKVYDNPEKGRAFKETDPLGGKDPYSASKAGAEIVTASYAHSFFNDPKGPQIASARAGNVIGGGDWAANRIVPDCIRALQAKKAIILRNPLAIRPWQHVLEPLYGYLLLGSALALKNGARFSGAWNFGPSQGQMRSVEELAEAVVKAWGNGSIKIDKPKLKLHEAGMLRLDSSKSGKLLGWAPRLDFMATVAQTVDEYRQMSVFQGKLFTARQESIRRYFVSAPCAPLNKKRGIHNRILRGIGGGT